MHVYWIIVAAVNCARHLTKEGMDENAFMPWSCAYTPELNMSISA